ncbi:Holliday junction-specific endonuclease [Spiroplasma gladiatoris]|uniref:Holliday junction resolvase RecU n=1 Tax=Spiroplasma gladiatoris TaxID=2143 RepID=A0A4P7AIE2_9MOLU|nr:Holliday junction resolvase RecU [Spiroplasma gladiatoris]QBQ07508.1 Holliday junction-specific endonuclease [Spiroplasma gladiatoris]
MILANKGMYLETIINNCLEFWISLGLLVQKMPVNNKLISIENNIIKAKLDKNQFCDYNGIYKGFYLEFEAKETSKNYFDLNNLKKNQVDKLDLIMKLKGLTFILIYFHMYDKYFCLNYSYIKKFRKKKIEYDWFINNCYELQRKNLVLDLISYLNHLISYI